MEKLIYSSNISLYINPLPPLPKEVSQPKLTQGLQSEEECMSLYRLAD